MAVEKIEKQIFKEKVNLIKIHREKSEIIVLRSSYAWMDHEDDDVA